MKHVLLMISLLLLTACGKPNIEIGMNIKDIKALAEWDVKGEGGAFIYTLTEDVSIFTEKGVVDSVRIIGSGLDLPFTIEGLDMSNLNDIASYHNTERTQFLGGEDGLKLNAYTKDDLWLWYGSSKKYKMNIAIISNNAWRGYDSLETPVPVLMPYDLKDMAELIYKAHHCEGYVEGLGISDTVFKTAQKTMMQNISVEDDTRLLRRYVREVDTKPSETECNIFLTDFVQISDEELRRFVDIGKLGA